MNDSGRSEAERERARLERERRRIEKSGGTPPPLPPPANDSPTETFLNEPIDFESLPEAPLIPPVERGAPSFEDHAYEPQESVAPPLVEPASAVPPPFVETRELDPLPPLPDDFGRPPTPPAARDRVNRGGRRGIAAIGAVFLLIIIWFLVAIFQPFAGGGKGKGAVPVTIPKGATVSSISTLLHQKGVIKRTKFFRWRANWSGKSDDFKAGRYKLGKGMSYGAAIAQLAKGPNAGITTVTVIEGKSRYEVAQQVASLGLTGNYMTATKSNRLLNPHRYGAPKSVDSLEGFLFPATYNLAAGSSVDRLVPQQLQAFKTNIASINMRFARSKNLTVFDVVTIASLVEREAAVPRERKLIASVIYNRLKAGIPLGIDATTRFETRNWTQPITEAQLKADTPYNTRLNSGLPPGPIGSPGLASLQAAAHPAKTKYLYYVANPCKPGTHSFSTTNAQFEKNVARYEKARVAAGDKQPHGC